MNRNLLVLSVYGEDQAGTRLRACQYEPHLRQAGIDVGYWSFLSATDSPRWFGHCSRRLRAVILLRSGLRLLWLPMLIRRADAVLVLREAVPLATTAVERLAARSSVLIWDVDDAIWTDYPRLFARWLPRRLRRTSRKYEVIAGLADEVWAGSDFVATWCTAHAARVLVIPTVVPVPALVPTRADRTRTLAWVGSASTSAFLEESLAAIEPVDLGVEVRCVGAKVAGTDRLPVRCEPWSQAAEDAALNESQVGLYPLSTDHPLAAGKAGLKAVLYMAHGLPSVVTPTDTTAMIVRDDVDGLHARTSEEWRDAVGRLLDDEALWERLSRSGHRRAATDFSLQAWAPRVVARVQDLVRVDT